MSDMKKKVSSVGETRVGNIIRGVLAVLVTVVMVKDNWEILLFNSK